MNESRTKIIDSAVSDSVMAEVNAIPLEDINVAQPELFRDNTMWPYFERLRKEDPVHYCKDSLFGPYWSVTKYKDIMTVEMDHKTYSSDTANGGITIEDDNLGLGVEMFIALDPPKHDEQRKVVSPMVSPENLARMEETIRGRTRKMIEELPVNETFDWVEKVSVNLTTQMLTTLFDFPFEERHKLTRWSDIAAAQPGSGLVDEETRMAELGEMLAYFTKMWNERAAQDPKPDLISMMAHSEAMRDITPVEYMGNLILLIVGGNDTTRNSMTGSVLALNQNPDQYQKLCDNPKLVESMIPEVIRWQTPLASMRRTAVSDAELGGKKIKKGDKVVMWYVSANRDPEAIDDPEAFIIDRKRPRQHLSFGFGIHRCVGNRVAELQLKILWEELLKRWPEPNIEVVGEPERGYSCILRTYTSLPVRINE